MCIVLYYHQNIYQICVGCVQVLTEHMDEIGPAANHYFIILVLSIMQDNEVGKGFPEQLMLCAITVKRLGWPLVPPLLPVTSSFL